MVNNTHHLFDVLCHFSCILDGFRKVQVHNVVTIVSDSNLIAVNLVIAGAAHAQDGFASLA